MRMRSTAMEEFWRWIAEGLELRNNGVIVDCCDQSD